MPFCISLLFHGLDLYCYAFCSNQCFSSCVQQGLRVPFCCPFLIFCLIDDVFELWFRSYLLRQDIAVLEVAPSLHRFYTYKIKTYCLYFSILYIINYGTWNIFYCSKFISVLCLKVNFLLVFEILYISIAFSSRVRHVTFAWLHTFLENLESWSRSWDFGLVSSFYLCRTVFSFGTQEITKKRRQIIYSVILKAFLKSFILYKDDVFIIACWQVILKSILSLIFKLKL